MELHDRLKRSSFIVAMSKASPELASRAIVVFDEIASKLHATVRGLTPIQNEQYFPSEGEMVAAIHDWIKQSKNRLYFLSGSGVFLFDRTLDFTNEFLLLFADSTGISTEDLSSGVKFGYCEGYYIQKWGRSV